MTTETIESVVDRFKEAHILVVGDAMLDKTCHGVLVKSPDVPEFRPCFKVKKISYGLGGSANTAANIRGLGSRVSLFCLLGGDEAGKILREEATRSEVNITPVFDNQRRTVMKMRFYEQTGTIPHYTSRADFDGPELDGEMSDDVRYITPEQYAVLEDKLITWRDPLAAILVEDYAKGMIQNDVLDLLKRFSAEKKVPLIVDPNDKTPFDLYRGVDVLKPNRKEAGILLETSRIDSMTGEDIVMALADRYACSVVMTDGSKGMFIIDKEHNRFYLPAANLAGKAINTVGAGDTVAAVLTIGLGLRLDLVSAAMIANAAVSASIQLNQVCGRPTPSQFITSYRALYENTPLQSNL